MNKSFFQKSKEKVTKKVIAEEEQTKQLSRSKY